MSVAVVSSHFSFVQSMIQLTTYYPIPLVAGATILLFIGYSSMSFWLVLLGVCLLIILVTLSLFRYGSFLQGRTQLSSDFSLLIIQLIPKTLFGITLASLAIDFVQSEVEFISYSSILLGVVSLLSILSGILLFVVSYTERTVHIQNLLFSRSIKLTKVIGVQAIKWHLHKLRYFDDDMIKSVYFLSPHSEWNNIDDLQERLKEEQQLGDD